MTLSEFRAYVRSLLAEPQASYWTDEEIDAYMKVAIVNIMGLFFNLLYPIYSSTSYLSVVAGSNYVALPEDCYKVISVKLANEPEKEFPYIPENLRDYYEAAGDLEGWHFEGGQIKIYPTPAETKANYLKIRYLPKFTDLEDVPEFLHPLLAVETVIQAKVKDENIPAYLMVLKQDYYANAVRTLTINQYQNSEYVI